MKPDLQVDTTGSVPMVRLSLAQTLLGFLALAMLAGTTIFSVQRATERLGDQVQNLSDALVELKLALSDNQSVIGVLAADVQTLKSQLLYGSQARGSIERRIERIEERMFGASNGAARATP